MTLKQFFDENKKAALAFSGGVDSSYLLYAAKEFGAEIMPYFVKSPFQPQFELDDANRLAEDLKCGLKVIYLDQLDDGDITANDRMRCYYCKKKIFAAIKNQAATDRFTLLLDGTNASDEEGDRAGMRALSELAVKSPLRECGLTKEEIRRLSKEAGLFTWDKPSYACLATRIPTGTKITKELLEKVEKTEDILFGMGFSDLRVRVIPSEKGDIAKIQIPDRQMIKVIENKDVIMARFCEYFSDILLDLKGR